MFSETSPPLRVPLLKGEENIQHMDIKIIDSWLREHLETNAKPHDIARALSLTSASIEKIEEINNDYVYHVEVTTNRVDMASVTGIAREAAAVLPQFGFEAA